jgi:signal transduction histidine kinase
MDGTRPQRDHELTRRVLLIRVVIYTGAAAILAVAGVTASYLGWLILGAYLAIAIWSAAVRSSAPVRRIGLGVATTDVLAPSLTGILVGHDPYSLHLLVGAQIVGVLLVATPRTARLVAWIGFGGILAGLIAGEWPTPIVLSPSGYRIAELGAVALGAGLGLMVLATTAARSQRTRRRLEHAAAIERHHVEATRRFVSMVNHELRTPLTSIRGYADLLRSNRAELSPDETAEFLEIIAGQSEHLSRLVEDILVLLRLEAGRLPVTMESVQISEVATNVEQSIDLPPDRDLDWDVSPGVIAAADPDRLFQVLRNLIENAVKYGGPHIQVAAQRRDGTVSIEVSDDGTDEVFEEYTRLDESRTGLGLGLPIVKGLVEAMGGTIGYRPTSAGLMGFVIELRAAAEAADRLPDPAVYLGQVTEGASSS